MDEKAKKWPLLDPDNVSKFLEESDWNLKVEVNILNTVYLLSA